MVAILANMNEVGQSETDIDGQYCAPLTILKKDSQVTKRVEDNNGGLTSLKALTLAKTSLGTVWTILQQAS